jgi:hypothetical protein
MIKSKHNVNGINLAVAAANMQECLPRVPHPSQSAEQILVLGHPMVMISR